MEIPIGSGVPTGPRGGTHRARGSNIPTHGTIGTASLTLDHTHTFNMHFLIQLYSKQLRVSHILM